MLKKIYPKRCLSPDKYVPNQEIFNLIIKQMYYYWYFFVLSTICLILTDRKILIGGGRLNQNNSSIGTLMSEARILEINVLILLNQICILQTMNKKGKFPKKKN